MDLGLTGKGALVTGATAGIGLAVAELLAKEGAIVGLNGRDPAKVERAIERIRNAGGTAKPIVVDLLDEDGPERVAEMALAELGQVDVLVNNAGGAVPAGAGAWDDPSPLGWRATFDFNAVVPVRLAALLAGPMRERGWGRIINVSSAVGREPAAAIPAYNASKAALNNLTKSLSRDLGGSGVTANVVSPGVTKTPALWHFLGTLAEESGWGDDPAEIERRYTESLGVSARRLGDAEEVARAIVFLASTAGSYVNGINLAVDGGLLKSI